MSKRIVGTTPKVDGFRMPGEFEEQEQIWMLWPWRNDNWRLGAKPAQKAFLDVAKAMSQSHFVYHLFNLKMLSLVYLLLIAKISE